MEHSFIQIKINSNHFRLADGKVGWVENDAIEKI